MTDESTQTVIDAAVAAAVAGLKEKNDEVLGKLSKAKQDLADIETAKAQELEDAEQAKLSSEGKLEELITRLKDNHATELSTLKGQLKVAQESESKAVTDLRTTLVDKGLADGFLSAGVTNPDLLAAAVALNKDSAVIENTEDGIPLVTMNGKPIAEFMTEWASTKGKAFISSGGGGGSAGGDGSGGTNVHEYEKYFQEGTINVTKQQELKNVDREAFDSIQSKYKKDVPLPLSAPVRAVG